MKNHTPHHITNHISSHTPNHKPLAKNNTKNRNKKIQAVGFDFDGTLILSEKIKAQAFAKIFHDLYNINHGLEPFYQKISKEGISRQEKITQLMHHFLKRPPTKKEIKNINQLFTQFYETSLRTCPLFACTNILSELKKKVNFLFLLSLEEKSDVLQILKHCGLHRYFNEVLGGPASKVDNLKHIIKKHHLNPSQIIYVGDKTSDIIACKKVKIKVVLLQKRFNYHTLRETLAADFVFSSLCDLPLDINKYS